MNYPLPDPNAWCNRFGHMYGRRYVALGKERRTCHLDGHTEPRFPTVPHSREDYDDWMARGAPKDAATGDWVPAP